MGKVLAIGLAVCLVLAVTIASAMSGPSAVYAASIPEQTTSADVRPEFVPVVVAAAKVAGAAFTAGFFGHLGIRAAQAIIGSSPQPTHAPLPAAVLD
ncbi:MAG: hypothetical protein KGZ57_06090 [Dethiobacter sp.]|nr:hypothetical protein [Dethiobacter sp.]